MKNFSEREKDTSKISIQIIPETGSPRTLTNIFDYNPGEGPANAEMGDEADLKGNVPVTIKENHSRRPTVTVSADTSDEKYMRNLERNKTMFKMIVIDKTSMVGVQHVCNRCHIEKAVEKTVRDTKTMAYTILCPLFKEKDL